MFDQTILNALVEAKRSGRAVVLATIIRDQGSVPRHAGAKMLIYPDGNTIGTIGGGEMESRVVAASQVVLSSGVSDIVHYEFSDPVRGDPGICGGQMDVFMEPVLPDPTVLVIGCGHVGRAVVDLAHWLGFRVIASDDRPDQCNAEVAPHADEYLVAPPGEVAARAIIHNRTYIVAVTRSMPLDVEMLPALLKTPAPYIGVIGSRKRWASAAKQLAGQGIDSDRLKRIHAPIGIELKAETPREIALSIMAEIVACMRGEAAEVV